MGYPGGKSGPGVKEKLIRLMPPHETFCSPFLGHCALMLYKRPAAYNIGVDLDAEVIDWWLARSGENAAWRSHTGESAGAAGRNGGSAGARGQVEAPRPAARNLVGAVDLPPRPEGVSLRLRRGKLLCTVDSPGSAAAGESAATRRRRTAEAPGVATGGALAAPAPEYSGGKFAALAGENAAASSRFRFLRGDGLTFLASYPFQPADLIYCDPPYLMSTRSSGRQYHHEFTDAQHAELLATILELPCRVMISGYHSQMYAEALKGWNSIHFEVVIHRAIQRTEWVWFNFEKPLELHDTRFAGENTRKRQDLARKIKSWTGKLERMTPLERQALLVAIGNSGGNAVGIR